MTQDTNQEDDQQLSLREITELLEQQFINRFITEAEIEDEGVQSTITLMYRNGVSDGLRVATMLLEFADIHPAITTLDKQQRAIINAHVESLSNELLELNNSICDQVASDFNIDTGELDD